MRITNLTATAFTITFAAAGYMVTGSTALASCGGNICRTGTTSYGSTSYGSTSYGSTNNGSGYGASTANCPAGTSPSPDGTCLITGGYSGGYSSGSTGYSSGSTGYSSGSTGYSSGSTGYSSGGYSSGSTGYSSSTANCPAGTRASSDGTCLVTDSGASYFGGTRTGQSSSYTSYSNSTPSYSSYSSTTPTYTSGSTYSNTSPLASYSGQSSWTSRNAVVGMSGQEASYKYGSGSISPSYSDGNSTIVPFTTSSSISSTRLSGMGANEFLSPTTCPVSVYNPGGGKVLGCYSVSKPAPVRVTTRSVHTVRVVRPVIYVRYPIPIPVPFPVYNNGYGHGGNGYHSGGYYGGYNGGCFPGTASRYGNSWPGRPCG